MSGDPKNTNAKQSCTDEEALHWLLDGAPELESKAIACLYRRLLEKVRAWVIARGGSGDDAHDALTDALVAFIMVFRDGKYREEGKLDNFVFRIAQYKFYDECRRRGKGGDLSIEEIFPGGIPPELVEDLLEDADNESERELQELRLEQCLDQTGERCKERLIRFWVLGQSHEEIAAAMGDSGPDVSKTMKAKCQRKLETCMQNEKPGKT